MASLSRDERRKLYDKQFEDEANNAVNAASGQNVDDVMADRVVDKKKGVLTSLNDVDPAAPLETDRQTSKFSELISDLLASGHTVGEIRKIIEPKVAAWEQTLVSKYKFEAGQAQLVIGPLKQRIEADLTTTRSALKEGVKEVDTEVKMLRDVLQHRGVHGRFNALGELTQSSDELKEFFGKNEDAREMLYTALMGIVSDQSASGQLEQMLDAYIAKERKLQSKDDKEAALWKFAKVELKAKLPALIAKSVKLSPDAIMGTMGSRHVGADMKQFLDSETTSTGAKGTDAVAEKLNDDGEYAFVRFLSVTGEDQSLSWYPKNTIGAPRPLAPATGDNMKKVNEGLAADKWDMVVVYKKNDVLKWLREMPAKATAVFNSQVLLKTNQWADCTVEIKGATGSGIEVQYKPRGTEKFADADIHPDFSIGKAKVRPIAGDPAFERIQNCLLEVLARGKYNIATHIDQ